MSNANGVAVVGGASVNEAAVKFTKTLVAGAVKAAMKAAGASSSDLWKVPVGAIRVIEGFNVREEGQALEDHITALFDSIMANGFYTDRPLAGYVANEAGQQVIYIFDGHCRFAAVQRAIAAGAAIEDLPVVISPKGTGLEDLTVGLITKNAGKPLSPYEQSIVVQRLALFGWEPAKIHTKTQIPVQKIEGLLLLASAPAEVRELVRTDKVAFSEAVHQLKTNGSGAVEKLNSMVQDAIAKGHARVTTKHRAGHSVAQATKKEAATMADILTALKADPMFDVVPTDLRERINAVLTKIAQASGTAQAELDTAGETTGTSASASTGIGNTEAATGSDPQQAQTSARTEPAKAEAEAVAA